MATNKPPQRRIQGIRGSIPSGYLLGRISQGEGDVELIAPAQALGNGLFPSTKISLVMPAQFSVAGSPVTNNGTFTVTWANESPNLVLAGPTSGGAAAPTFRALVAADIPNLGANPSATASDAAVNGSATTYMRSDGAPAIQKASNTVFGIGKVDNTTIIAVAGVLSVKSGVYDASGAAATAQANAEAYTDSALNSGAWTPTDVSGAGLSLTINSATWVRAGHLYFYSFDLNYPVNASGANMNIGGLITVGARVIQPFVTIPASAEILMAIPAPGNAFFESTRQPSGISVTNAYVSGLRLIGCCVFTV